MINKGNIDDFVKGRMPGDEAANFERSTQNDAALRQTVDNQQMVVNLFQQMNNQNLVAEIQQARIAFESSQKEVPDEAVIITNKQTPQTVEANSGGQATAVIKILFNCDDEMLEVIEMNYSFHQEVDQIGQPSSKVTGGRINLKLPFIKNSKWYAWMIDPTMKKDGVLIYMDANGNSKKRLVFKEAWCAAYEVNYKAFSNETIKENAIEHLTLVARKISIDGESFEI